MKKRVLKKMKLDPRTGRDVQLKIRCARETADYAMQMICLLKEMDEKIDKETTLYQEAKPGGYRPSSDKRVRKARGKTAKRRCRGRK
ncbi:MAG: hypothetical protein FD189_1850 [Elusimicrobia bacterium]|nr:MAG: hypothetical protein FD154_2027 [Elusimicrobiota bacterium]KAF0154528.1 MAG: hypothetical protein FD189_1850 [Elusimicrobiota bacterium]